MPRHHETSHQTYQYIDLRVRLIRYHDFPNMLTCSHVAYGGWNLAKGESLNRGNGFDMTLGKKLKDAFE